jgi:hypothetical protein
MKTEIDFDGLFNEQGNCPTLGDPFRERGETFHLLFDEDGNLSFDASQNLQRIVLERKEAGNPIPAFCDIAKLLIADDFAANTKGNYSTIYLWR